MALNEADLDQDAAIGDDQLAGSHRDGGREKNAGRDNKKQPRPVEPTPRREHRDRDNNDEAEDRADDGSAQRHPMDRCLMQRPFVELQCRRGISAEIAPGHRRFLRRRGWRWGGRGGGGPWGGRGWGGGVV